MNSHYDDELREYKKQQIGKDRVFVNVTPIIRWFVRRLRWLFKDL